MTRESRKGKHKECKTLFGAYVTPEVKALAELTSEKLAITFTDIILNGLNSEATRAGILVGGKMSPKFKEKYDALVICTREKIANSKKKGKQE